MQTRMQRWRRAGFMVAVVSAVAGAGLATAPESEASSCGFRTVGDVLVFDACAGQAGQQVEVFYHPQAPNPGVQVRYVCLKPGTTTIGPVWKKDVNFWKGGYSPGDRGLIGPC